MVGINEFSEILLIASRSTLFSNSESPVGLRVTRDLGDRSFQLLIVFVGMILSSFDTLCHKPVILVVLLLQGRYKLSKLEFQVREMQKSQSYMKRC